MSNTTQRIVTLVLPDDNTNAEHLELVHSVLTGLESSAGPDSQHHVDASKPGQVSVRKVYPAPSYLQIVRLAHRGDGSR